MNLGAIDSLQLLPGVFSSNAITVLRGEKKINLSVGNPTADQGGGPGNYEFESYDDDSSGEHVDDGMASDDQTYYYENESDFSIGKLTKFGVDFQMNFSFREGNHTAIRTLVELGIIELIGKYARLPYWECLSADPKRFAINAMNDIEEAAAQPTKDTHAEVEPTKKENTTISPFNLSLKPPGTALSVTYQRGDSVELVLTANRNAYAYCYYIQHNGEIFQIYPTPFTPSNVVFANKLVEIPGDKRLQIKVDSPGPPERVQCVAHRTDSAPRLTAELTKLKFEKIDYKSFDALLEVHKTANASVAVSDTFIIYQN